MERQGSCVGFSDRYLLRKLSHNHRLSRWLAQPYKGMLLAGLKAHRTKKQQLQNCAASTNVELCFNDITILRYALSGIVVFQSKTTPTMLNFYVITYLTFCFLFNGKSLFGTTRLAGGFRMPKSARAKPVHFFVWNQPCCLFSSMIFAARLAGTVS